jgi:UDP:flavonoid glycosyltransferase YjiC (YdhE family)
VIGHAGHGTLVRALSCGCPVLAVPHAGDMAENAARVDWAGAGIRLPWPLLSPGTLRLATGRALADRSLAETARRLAAWSGARSGAQRAADLVEGLARGRQGTPASSALPATSRPGDLNPPGAGARRR